MAQNKIWVDRFYLAYYKPTALWATGSFNPVFMEEKGILVQVSLRDCSLLFLLHIVSMLQ